MDYKHIDFPYIVNWCKENKQTEWLKDVVNSQVPVDKEDASKGMRDITFIEVKRIFCEKFMKELLPVAKPKKPSMKDIVNAL